MRRAAVLALALIGMLATADADVVQGLRPLGPGSVFQGVPAQGAFERLFLSYSSGDYGVVSRTLRTDQDYLGIRRDLYLALGRWRKDWQRVHAVFLVEVLISALEHGWQDGPDLIVSSRQFVVDRPEKPGANPANDRFEILWHKTVLGLLQGSLMSQTESDYLRDISRRVGPRGTVPGGGGPPLVEPRLALAAAIAQEQLATPGSIARLRRSSTAPLTLLPLDGPARRAAEETERRFDEAATYPANFAEASIRKAFLWHRLGRFDEALALLDRQVDVPDRALAYLTQLFRGRTLDKVNRRDEAIAAYELADKALPGTQSPAVALAVLNVQLDHRDAALRWAELARNPKAAVNDPWWQYWLGDLRFVSGWLGQLREAAR